MSGLNQILVVDANQRRREALAFAFERAGCVVRGTGDALEALGLIDGWAPQVAVVSMQLKGLEAAALARALRRKRRRAELPLLMVGEERHRDDLRGAGADVYLGVPAFLRDVVAMARVVAASTEQEGIELADAGGAYGLTRAIHAARWTVVVSIQRGEVTGELRFDGGELVGARAGGLAGVGAFRRLLLWGGSRGQIRTGEAPPLKRRIETPTRRLLEEGLAFLDEFERVAARFGGQRVVYAADPAKIAELTDKVPPEVLAFCSRFDGRSSLKEIVAEAPFKAVDTLVITGRLIEAGVLARRKAPKRRGAPSPLSVTEWVLDRGGERQAMSVAELSRRVLAESQPSGGGESGAVAEAVTDDLGGTLGPIPAATIEEAITGRVTRGVRRKTLEGIAVGGARRRPAPASAPTEASRPAASSPLHSAIEDADGWGPASPSTVAPVAGGPATKGAEATSPAGTATAPPPPVEAGPPTVAPPAVGVPAAPDPLPARLEVEASRAPAVAPPTKLAREAPAQRPTAKVEAPPSPPSPAPRPRIRRSPPPLPTVPLPPGLEALSFDAFDEEFFARAEELAKVDPVDTFADLEEPAPTRRKTRTWFRSDAAD